MTAFVIMDQTSAYGRREHSAVENLRLFRRDRKEKVISSSQVLIATHTDGKKDYARVRQFEGGLGELKGASVCAVTFDASCNLDITLPMQFAIGQRGKQLAQALNDFTETIKNDCFPRGPVTDVLFDFVAFIYSDKKPEFGAALEVSATLVVGDKRPVHKEALGFHTFGADIIGPLRGAIKQRLNGLERRLAEEVILYDHEDDKPRALLCGPHAHRALLADHLDSSADRLQVHEHDKVYELAEMR